MPKIFTAILLFSFLAGLIPPNFVFASITDGTIDSTYKYAWSENTGWLNFGTSEGNVHITDSELTGYVWGENIGWISLNCSNDSSCGTVDYKISNDNEGNLSGYAWSENTGWINFNPSYGGVTINSSGEFLGYAWGENIGWIVFDCNTSACVKTDWRARSARPACNNAIDDDNDGKIDYPADPGCDSLTDNDETDPGGGLPPAAYNPPTPPAQGFSILINKNVEYSDSRTITLKLNGGPDAKKMAISNFSDFRNASQIPYQTTKTWTLIKGEGEKTVYVKFYTQWGQPSEIISDVIILKSKEIKEPIKEIILKEIQQKIIEILEKLISLYVQLISILKI